MRRAVRSLLVAVAIGGVIFLFVLPGRTWLSQARATSTARHQVSVLSQENQALTKQIANLHDPNFIAQIARQQYGLVMPGEKAYAILVPATAPPTTLVPPPKKQQKH